MSFRRLERVTLALALASLACSPGPGRVRVGPELSQAPLPSEPTEKVASSPRASSLLDAPLCQGAAPSCELFGEVEVGVRRQQAGPNPPLRAKLESAIAAAPGDARLHIALGRVVASGEQLTYGSGGANQQEALREFDRALELDPSSSVALLERARALLSLGRGAEAEAALLRLKAAFPKDPEVLGALGVCWLSLGRVREAKVELKRAAEIASDDAERWVVLGAAEMLLGERGQANASFRSALHLDPNHVRAHADLGALLLLDGRTSEGRAHLVRAQALDPRSPAILTNLSYANYLEGHLEEARQSATRALELDATFVSAWLNLALVLAAQGNFGEAREAVARARALNPDDPRVQTAESDLREAEQASPR